MGLSRSVSTVQDKANLVDIPILSRVRHCRVSGTQLGLPEPCWYGGIFYPAVLVHGSVLRGYGMNSAVEPRMETLVVDNWFREVCTGHLGYHDSRQDTVCERGRLASCVRERANGEATGGKAS